MVVATCNVRTLAVKGKNGYGNDERILAKGRQLGCDFIGRQETRRADSTILNATGYQVFCPGQENSSDARVMQTWPGSPGVDSRKSVHTHEFIDERLMSMRFELAGILWGS